MSGAMAAASLALAAAGTAMSVSSSIKKGEADAAAGRQSAQMAAYQAQVARNNQIIANQQADSELQAGEVQATNQSMKGAAEGGFIKAGQGAGGVDVNTGTAVDVQASQRQVAQLDTETVMSNAQRRAYGYRSQATNFSAQAGLDESQAALTGQGAGASQTAGMLGAGGTLLSKSSGLPFKWLFGGGTTSDLIGGPDGMAGLGGGADAFPGFFGGGGGAAP